MRNVIISLLLSAIFSTGFSQNSRFEYAGRFNPAIKKAQLSEARDIYEIMPQFSRYFVLPFNDRSQFDKQVVSVFPTASFYPPDNFDYLINYTSVEISAICNGKAVKAQSKNDILTCEQQNIINAADLGTDLSIKIKFTFKNEPVNTQADRDKIIEGEYTVTVVPETEAKYPGGYKQFAEYFTENVFNKIPESLAAEKIQQAVLKFTVNEQGQILDARISKTSTDPKIDNILLDATNKMPIWMPAQNSKGIKVKQEFSIPFGGGGC